jgi:transposase-like protein
MGTAKKNKREYSTEFKIDAARLVVDQGYTVKETCERLGIPLSNMTRWLSQYREGKLQPGHKQQFRLNYFCLRFQTNSRYLTPY